MEYVGQVPAPPLDQYIDDIYCLTRVPRHRRMNVPPMPSAHLFVNLGDPARLWDCDPSVPPAVFADGWFLSTFCTTTVAWPHDAAAVDYHAVEGRSWRNWLSDDGARAARLPTLSTMPATAADEASDAADASARGTANELVLVYYGRIPLDSLKLDGNRRLFDQLVKWDPER